MITKLILGTQQVYKFVQLTEGSIKYAFYYGVTFLTSMVMKWRNNFNAPECKTSIMIQNSKRIRNFFIEIGENRNLQCIARQSHDAFFTTFSCKLICIHSSRKRETILIIVRWVFLESNLHVTQTSNVSRCLYPSQMWEVWVARASNQIRVQFTKLICAIAKGNNFGWADECAETGSLRLYNYNNCRAENFENRDKRLYAIYENRKIAHSDSNHGSSCQRLKQRHCATAHSIIDILEVCHEAFHCRDPARKSTKELRYSKCIFTQPVTYKSRG